MAANDEPPEEQPGGGGIGSRLAGAFSQGRQTVRRTSDVFTGADIRRFDEFTDAVTRVIVGIHQDQAELQEQLARLEKGIADIHQTQADQAKKVAAIELMLDSHVRRAHGGIWERIWRMVTSRT